ncbi:hypothetical protein DXG01_011893 [Tephrocybe rancida]|nr:hypothetical protein DXG01_011893 [Tephrocybe rancida]
MSLLPLVGLLLLHKFIEGLVAGSTSTPKRFLQSIARRPRGPSSTSTPTPFSSASSTWKHEEPVQPPGNDWKDDFVLITQKDLPIRLDKPEPHSGFGAYHSSKSSSFLPPPPPPVASQRVQLADLCLDFPQPPTFIPSPREDRPQEPPSRLKALSRLVRSSFSSSATKRSPSLIARIFNSKTHPPTPTLPDDSHNPAPQYSYEAPTSYIHTNRTSFTLPSHLVSPPRNLPESSPSSLLSPLQLSTRHPTLRPKPSFGASFISQSTISRNSSTSGYTAPFPAVAQSEHSSQGRSDSSFFADNTRSPDQHYHRSHSENSDGINDAPTPPEGSQYNFPIQEDAAEMFTHRESPPLRDLADYGGKRTDVVDFGGGIDYTDHKWFQDKPKRPAAPPPQPEYTPAPDVINMNDAFEYALSSAPNVLYARYKQYGQLGVLAWCSEFGELIDGLKELGFQGNMFTTTRTQALETCAQLLKLPMEIEMQLIIMYLSGQVSRLRHFLDSDTVWDDYPIPRFPVHPPQVSISPMP